ncbi:uncharacterized protein LOC123270907 [Cotesia glomerata]|uniref:uncharacterized protein LOC123270907 n=1 Tax=Cotesia glomerata TaxID=32391 RepID=UPI001D0298C0|nr:uncharacterized protein LOC123270907 [Cotesia glomerata]
MTEFRSDEHSGIQEIDEKNKLINENERLNFLEREVCKLRTDVDKIKWEQAVTEALIGRAIIRGSASLADCYGFLLPQDILRNNKNMMVQDLKQDNKLNKKGLISNQETTTSKLNKSCDPCPVKNKNNNNNNHNKEDEFFTFG